MDTLIRTIQLRLLVTNLHSQGLEKSIGNMGVKNRTLFIFFDRVLVLQMKVCHFGMSK